VAERKELVRIIDSEAELLDACALCAEGKTQVQRMVKALKIAAALGASMTRASKKRKDPVLRQIFAVRGLALHVAEACNVSRQALDHWQKVPPQHVATVSRMIGMPPHEIRPDLFPHR
jgi:DNA-binding transcriptional regulator YdaS (Cro superfamily)